MRGRSGYQWAPDHWNQVGDRHQFQAGRWTRSAHDARSLDYKPDIYVDQTIRQHSVGVSFDWLAAAHAISRAVRTHQARGEVERAIADYCIAHRDEPGAEAICAEPFR
jgi:hypothetical protein